MDPEHLRAGACLRRLTAPPRLDGCPLTLGAGRFGESVQAVEHRQSRQGDQVDVPLGKTSRLSTFDRPPDLLLTGREFGQEMDEDVGHRHASGGRQPDAARRATKEAQRGVITWMMANRMAADRVASARADMGGPFIRQTPPMHEIVRLWPGSGACDNAQGCKRSGRTGRLPVQGMSTGDGMKVRTFCVLSGPTNRGNPLSGFANVGLVADEVHELQQEHPAARNTK